MEKLICLDCECYPNYFMVAFKSVNTGKVIIIDTKNTALSNESKKRVQSIMSTNTTFGYNSISYDLPMITYALSGATCKELYELSSEIVSKGQPDFISYKSIGMDNPNYDHFDIKEPAPAVMISLKNYGTRVGSKKLWELPYESSSYLNDEQIENLKKYCENDLDTTIDLYKAIEARIQLRIDTSNQYLGIGDLRSKSDAQMAEAIFRFELSKVGVNIQKLSPKDRIPKNVVYKCPEFISFKSQKLNDLKELLDGAVIQVNNSNGQPILPKEWTKQLKPKIGDTVYKIGLGGIHSQEAKLVVKSDDVMVLRNADIASMYPSIILELGLFPKSLGKEWLSVYRKIYQTRLKAKAEQSKLDKEIKSLEKLLINMEGMTKEDIKLKIEELKIKRNEFKTINEGLKIASNGSYGKFGSMYSFLYAPELMLTVTITGQLMMLMLIEELESAGIRVVSSNTDGIEYLCPRDRVVEIEALIFDWELTTGMTMEHGEYKALYAKDVNNYVAVYDGYTKAKGLYTDTTLMKGRSTPIVYTAIREYLLNGTPLDETIYACKDINEFVSGRTVKGGGEYCGEYLGKVVRWYYSINSIDCIKYVSNGNKVPKTDGALPLMDLPDEMPIDLNYNWYVDEAISKLNDLGVEYAQ